jgi:1-acyl-sn-glycerol-3-phosphate acyltransferase
MKEDQGQLPTRSPAVIRWFIWYVRRYQLRPCFNAVRLALGHEPQDLPEGRSIIVVLNHASWWDPLVCTAAQELFPGRRHFAPIDARMLEKYGIFRKLGFFGVEQGSTRGAAQFLRTSQAILRQPDAVLWITAQGEFADVRARPVVLRRGIGHLLARADRTPVYPLAIEYPFWNEKRPEVLLGFGPPLLSTGRNCSPEEHTTAVAHALTVTMDHLAALAVKRDPAAFRILCRGQVGMSGVYDSWRRFTHWLRGRSFSPTHQAADSHGASHG